MQQRRTSEELPPIDENIPGCEGVVFIDVFPPSEAEMRCRGLDADGQPLKVEKKKKKPWTPGEQLPPVDETIPGCKDVAFIAISPPSEVELYCRGVVDKDGDPIIPE